MSVDEKLDELAEKLREGMGPHEFEKLFSQVWTEETRPESIRLSVAESAFVTLQLASVNASAPDMTSVTFWSSGTFCSGASAKAASSTSATSSMFKARLASAAAPPMLVSPSTCDCTSEHT